VKRSLLASLFIAFITACPSLYLNAQSQPDSAVAQQATVTPLIAIPNAKTPFPKTLVGGQPSIENIRAAHKAGYKTIVNLRPKSEFTAWNEAALVQELNMNYVLIPVSSEGDLNTDNVRKLDLALNAAGVGPTIVHCASGNRVGALFALRARLQGSSVEMAVDIGKSAGLTSLEPVIRKLLRKENY
jgi:uncharacterized protein (TIGR01244 family)